MDRKKIKKACFIKYFILVWKANFVFFGELVLKENKSNRSVLDILGIVSMVAILIGFGTVGVNEAIYRYKMNVIKQQIGTLATNIKNAYFGAGRYDDLDNALAISLGLVPENMRDKNDPHAIVNAFGGKVMLMATTAETGETCEATKEKPCDSFVIKMTNLPRKPTLELSVFPWKYLDMLRSSVDAEPTEGKPVEMAKNEKPAKNLSVEGVSIE